MSSDDEYYIILHVGGHFVKDLYVRYVGGEVIRLKEDPHTISYFELCKIVKIGLRFNTFMLIYFHEPGIVGLQNNLRVIYDDTSTIAMLDFWVKFKEIELYVEHEVDNPIIVDDIFLLTTGEGDDEGVESDGEGDLEKVESGGKGDVGEVQADGEGVSATGIEVDADIGGGHISLRTTAGEDNDSEVAGNEYAGDFATSDGVDNIADEYAGDFATSDGLDNVTVARSGEEEDGNEIEVWDSDEHGSLVESDEDEEDEDGERKRSKFPLYNDKLKFSLGMLFKDGKQFKSAIRKDFKECRRPLKFIKNEPKRVVMFQDEHHCSVSFKNKMVTTAMIAQHFEATIKDHPKMKLREIQRRRASKMHVNKIVNEKMARNHKDEFGLL
ncbi:hypothetical protein ERO13_A01G139471v2 [Gossypium hirsutum]|uniref:PB1-like domain-containing protein n=1 Tax=Gossypium barbadense TaxID=3634 RepID=A0A5J5WZ55_GOSBA|nr:hypothetical protein ES319_A01G146300v1 [Gossypium barbadense]KAG4214784.1 hypothetical protein ERO13_A01G139471v2 [Gossypium hirsutum]